MGLSAGFQSAALTLSAEQLTDEVIIADPGDGYKIVVYQLFVSSDTQAVFTFDDPDAFAFHSGADGGVVIDGRSPLLEQTASEALTVSTSASVTSGYVKVWYTIEDA